MGFDYYFLFWTRSTGFLGLFIACGEAPFGRRPVYPDNHVDPVKLFLTLGFDFIHFSPHRQHESGLNRCPKLPAPKAFLSWIASWKSAFSLVDLACLFLFSKKLESFPLFYGLTLVFFLQKGHYCVFYLLVVLGGELAVPFTRNPLNAGLNPRPRILYCRFLNHFDRTPRNRRSWTSSDPEGSSDKWRGPCRGSIPICTVF